jgi:hypothetical protein
MSFGNYLEKQYGAVLLLIIYFISMIGTNAIAMVMKNRFNEYFMVGALGAISGIMYTSIAYGPNEQIGLYGILYFPAFIWAVLYTGYTIYGIIKKIDYIGHEAHLGGGITGLLIATAFNPTLVFSNILYLAPAILMIIIFFGYSFYRNIKLSSNSIFPISKKKPSKNKVKAFVKTGVNINASQNRVGFNEDLENIKDDDR